MSDQRDPVRRGAHWRHLVGAVVGAAAAIIFITAYQIHHAKAQTIGFWQDRLSVESIDDVSMVHNWLAERLADAELLATAPAVKDALAGRKPQPELTDFLRKVSEVEHYGGIYVIDHSGRPLAAVADSLAAQAAAYKLAQRILSSEGSGVDLLGDPGIMVRVPHNLLLGVPVVARGHVSGAAIVLLDPDETLYPMLLGSVDENQTAESLLVTVADGHLRYISKRRFPATSGSAESDNLISAATHPGAITETTDYRRHRVFAVARPVPGTAWAIVNKVDADEALADYRHSTLWKIVAAALIMAVFVGLLLWYQQRMQAEALAAALRQERLVAGFEARLRQSQKLEALGRLASGIAHDFNNLLTVITGNSQFLLEAGNRDERVRQWAAEIQATSERASALVKQLLSFSRSRPASVQLVNINALVSGLVPILRRLVGRDVELKAELVEDAPAVKADPTHIEQIVLNLVVNARDAMPSGGRVVIRTSHEVLSAAHPDRAPGRYLRLAVADTGTGIPSEVKAHIFEPFFTTKSKEKGTGLGLAVVYGAVRQAGGTIDVSSEAGQGTTFEIYLPAASAASDVAAMPPPPAAPGDRARARSV